MRIIDGFLKRRNIQFDKKIQIRPTTDFAKEALFNIITSQYDLKTKKILDLCAGSGNISYEFCSRESLSVTSVDFNSRCIRFMKKQAEIMKIKPNIIECEIINFLRKTKMQFDIIFADPPYKFKKTELIHEIIFKKKILLEGGMLIIEHPDSCNFSSFEKHKETRKYGKVHFSFFENQ
ncbi:MAG: 16S rRNA (guanine(966)-N(2))-methyltransferase RsmD [Flavobacteriales bacterium]|nr:16S rRNA (guanine(966)-N(2))-methyltransferase RsmD [Flavobacteriales bacterium]